MNRRPWRLLAPALALLLAFGCNDASVKPMPSPAPEPSTPSGVLDDLREAYLARDVEGLMGLLHADFVFTASRQDADSVDAPLPGWWGIADERMATTNLFRSRTVDAIALSFTQSAAEPVDGDSAGLWRVRLSQVDLSVTTHDRQDSVIVYQVQDGLADIYLKQYPAITGSGQIWQIVRWEDEPAGPALRALRRTGAISWSWARIKYHFATLDTVPPARVTTLAAHENGSGEILLTWQAVGDDSVWGRASGYDLRYSRDSITAENWKRALAVVAPSHPNVSGAMEAGRAFGLSPESVYHFALKVEDEAGNWSLLSNQVVDTTTSLYLPQDSPANCLDNLLTAYDNRDLQGYVRLFSDDFTFVFSPEDVQNPTNPTPPSWQLGDERQSADHMFMSELVDKIEVSYVQSPAVSSDSEFPGTWRVNVTLVSLRVYTHKPDDTPWVYRVPNGTARFYLKEYPDEHASNGRPLWRIWQWQDSPLGLSLPSRFRQLRVQETTWGRIKAKYL